MMREYRRLVWYILTLYRVLSMSDIDYSVCLSVCLSVCGPARVDQLSCLCSCDPRHGHIVDRSGLRGCLAGGHVLGQPVAHKCPPTYLKKTLTNVCPHIWKKHSQMSAHISEKTLTNVRPHIWKTLTNVCPHISKKSSQMSALISLKMLRNICPDSGKMLRNVCPPIWKTLTNVYPHIWKHSQISAHISEKRSEMSAHISEKTLRNIRPHIWKNPHKWLAKYL